MTPEKRAAKALEPNDRLYDREWLIPNIAAAIREAELMGYLRGLSEERYACASIIEDYYDDDDPSVAKVKRDILKEIWKRKDAE